MTTERSDGSLAEVDALEGEDVASLLASLADDDPTERQRAARAVERLAGSDVEAATEFVDALAALLDDESLAVRRAGAEALVPIAEAIPESLLGSLDSVLALLTADTADLALAGAEILRPLVLAHPDSVAPHADRLCAVLTEGAVPEADEPLPETVETAATREAIRNVLVEERERTRYVRETVANVVVAAAEVEPTCLATQVDTLGGLLADPNPVVVGSLVDALGLLGEETPEAVAPVHERLLACLDHDAPTVRARTVRTLGLVGDREAVPRLRDVATDDPDDDVRELAAETAAFLTD